jgi:penicillin-binding protein 1A
MKKFFVTILVLLCVAGVLAVGAVGFVYYRASRDLPEITGIANFLPLQAGDDLARGGSALRECASANGNFVPLARMSRYIPLAVLATEDTLFYQRDALSLTALLRKLWAKLLRRMSGQGIPHDEDSITVLLLRQCFGSPLNAVIVRQFDLNWSSMFEWHTKRAILAWRVERRLTKDEILTVYLNRIFFGNNAYGVEAAARVYFGKHTTDITLAESALIASLPQAPSSYNPLRHPEEAKTRQMHALGRMRTLGWISEPEYQQAVAEPLVYSFPERRAL